MKYSITKVFFITFPLVLLGNTLFSQTLPTKVCINEFLASNSTTIADPNYHKYSDWIEIYNNEDTLVDLSGYYLTDDLNDSHKWLIPDGTNIRAGWRLIFWADDQDEGRHTNFKLSKNGEAVGLFAPDGSVIDTISFPPQFTDISFGRYPDGGSDWYFQEPPTPGTINSSQIFRGIVSDPQISLPDGFYQGTQIIEISSGDSAATIRYTLDGSTPDETSQMYSSPFYIDSTTAVRTRAFKHDYYPSLVITHSFFIDESIYLPVVSLVTDPPNLWDDEIGIYVEGTNGIPGYCSPTPKNWNQDWERPVNIALFERDGSLGFKMNAGVKIGGGCTRKYPQKSLAIYARREYGESKINYQVFEDKPIHRYNNLMLRNAGQDWYRALFRDGFMQNLVKDRMDIDWQSFKPAMLFLNGEYWGIHNIREKHNEHYLESNYGIDPDAIDILYGNAKIKQGSAQHYLDMLNFIDSNDMALHENYEYVKSLMDMDEYLNYQIAEIYFANIDWPGGNIKFWREQTEAAKWRWIFFDLDLGFGAHPLGQYYSNSLANATATSPTYYANPAWSTFLFRKLLENSHFQNQFIQRFASHLNTTFLSVRAIQMIDSMQAYIAPAIPRHKLKWNDSMTMGADSWEEIVEIMREFAEKRPAHIFQHIQEKFNLNSTALLTVTVSDPVMGKVLINQVAVPGEHFHGIYFQDIPIECRAIANTGYRFSRWQGMSEADTDSVTIILANDDSLVAVFEPDEYSAMDYIFINEFIALNNTGITDQYGEHSDWIEIFNAGDNAVDVGGLYITDDLSEPDAWEIPTNCPDSTTIPPGGFLLLWADKDPEEGILHVNIKLSGDGEQIGLAQQSGANFVYIDSLEFGGQTADISYGRYPDGNKNMQFFEQPTPGAQNFVPSSVAESPCTPVPSDTRLYQNYPNPFNPQTTINFQISTIRNVSIKIYNLLGKEVATLINQRMLAGNYQVKFDGSKLPGGIYFYKMQAGQFSATKKFVLIK